MKQYTKPLLNTTPSTHNNEIVSRNGMEEAAKRTARGGFLLGTLTDTQILTNELYEFHDRFLDQCYKEWEQWLNNYEFRQAQRDFYKPYTPTDFT